MVKTTPHYSLIESAKLCGVDPKRYLLVAPRAALVNRAAVALPHMLLAGYSNGVCPPAPRVAQ
jgi:hypothetical protein